jgi:hypothetical protein
MSPTTVVRSPNSNGSGSHKQTNRKEIDMGSTAGQRRKGAGNNNGSSIGAEVANLVGNVVDNAVGLLEDVANDSVRIARATEKFLKEATGA